MFTAASLSKIAAFLESTLTMATVSQEPLGSFSVQFIQRISLQQRKQQLLPQPILLENEWAFLYDRYIGPGHSVKDYAAAVKLIGTANTVQRFWSYYNNIPSVEKLGPGISYHLMRKGVLPLWEDPANVNGGHLAIKVARKHCERTWLFILLAVIGEQFLSTITEPDEICGASVSIRKNDAVISLWNRRTEQVNVSKFSALVRKILAEIQILDISYKVHKNEEHFVKQGSNRESMQSPHC